MDNQNILFNFAKNIVADIEMGVNDKYNSIKKTINTICVLIIVAIILSMVSPLYKLGYSFGIGFKAGIESVKSERSDDVSVLSDVTPLNVDFTPDANKMIFDPDKIKTDNQGQELPVVWCQGVVMYPDANAQWWAWIVNVVGGISIIVIFVLLLVSFVNFIVHVNKGRVFERVNVKILNKIGWYLLIIAAVEICIGLVHEWEISRMPYGVPGYRLSAAWEMPWNNIIIGLVSLLMAKVWGKGISMREEQELTI